MEGVRVQRGLTGPILQMLGGAVGESMGSLQQWPSFSCLLSISVSSKHSVLALLLL